MNHWFSRNLSGSAVSVRGAARQQRRPLRLPRAWIPRPAVEYDDPPEFQDLLDEIRAAPVQKLEVYDRLRERRGKEVADFFQTHLGDHRLKMAFNWSIRRHHVEALDADMDAIGVLQRVNNSRWINKYFRAVNSRLQVGGIFTGCLEANEQRKDRLFTKYPKGIAEVRYGIDFLIHRLCPKIPVLKRVYFAVTRGHNRPLSAAEALGRLVSCGFDIVDYRPLNGLTYFAVQKRREAPELAKPTYGPLCALKRVGKNRRIITVYKLRTMHPYAEFLQEYLFTRNGTQNGDKINNDFRVAAWAGILRRVWLDELPMITNLLKGELKLVGVRPLSQHKFSTYPPELQELRTRFKPGLIPPCYVDMPTDREAFFESEERYLRAYEKSPLLTDLRYFFAAGWNILVRRARSA